MENTTLGVVATNATLTKAQATKIAQMAHDGYARAIYPAHLTSDGDTIFALATGSARRRRRRESARRARRRCHRGRDRPRACVPRAASRATPPPRDLK